jgi:hypothetical protein
MATVQKIVQPKITPITTSNRFIPLYKHAIKLVGKLLKAPVLDLYDSQGALVISHDDVTKLVQLISDLED